jgi:hypothetical protein
MIGSKGGLVGIDHQQFRELLAFVVGPAGPLATYPSDSNYQNRALLHVAPQTTD